MIDEERRISPDVREDGGRLQSLRHRVDQQLDSKCDKQPCMQDDSDVEQVDSCIWDSNDIQVLRQAFRETSNEHVRFRSQVRVLQEEVEKMSVERSDQGKALETTRQHLHDARTANRRLQMIVNHLRMELDRTTNQVDGLRSVETERSDLNGQLRRVQLELSAADCHHKTTIAHFEAKWRKELEEQRLADTEVKTRLNGDVARLKGKIEQLEQQLRREVEDHRRTREGLEHLRIHFSTLPASGEKLNCLHKDELNNWTY